MTAIDIRDCYRQITSPAVDGAYYNTPRPTILQSGNVGHGQPLTLNAHGFSFGAKAAQAPAIWENFQAGINGNSLQVYTPAWVKYDGPSSIGARVSANHPRYAGAKSAYNIASDGFSTNYRAFPATRKVYLSHYMYVATRGNSTGIMSNVTATGFTLTGANWTTNYWTKYVVMVTAGRGWGVLGYGEIGSNTTDTITFSAGGHGGWWYYWKVAGVSAGVDVPYTIVSGEVSIDQTGAGDSYGPWTAANGVVRADWLIRVRSNTTGVDGQVKIGADVQNPVYTLTAVLPDATSQFKIVPKLQLKQVRVTASGAAGGTPNNNYNGTGTHGLSSWHMQNDNNSKVEMFPNAIPDKTITCPTNEWYRLEVWIYLSDAGVANGYFAAQVTTAAGVRTKVEHLNLMNRQANETYLLDEVLLGLMFANLVTTDVEAYTTDIYLQSGSWSRIEIGNSASVTGGLRDPQPYNSWAANQIVINNQNVAGLPGNKYVWFFDDNDNASKGFLLS